MFRLNVNPANKSDALKISSIVLSLLKLLLLLMTYNQLRILIRPNKTATLNHERSPLIDKIQYSNTHNFLLAAECRPMRPEQQQQQRTNQSGRYAANVAEFNVDGHQPRSPPPPKSQSLPNRATGLALAPRNLILLHHQAEQPDFVEPIGNHTVAVGRDAQLACRISNLGNYRTAWLRVEDKGILTIHNNVITRNYRFGLKPDDDEQSFVLTIKNVQPSDKGGYMCQINSVPMKYAVGYLDVLTPPVFDDVSPVANQNGDGEPDSSSNSDYNEQLLNRQQQQLANSSQVTVAEGSSATLTCQAQGHPKPTITWRREDGRPIMLNGFDSNVDLASAPTEIKDTSSLSFVSVNRLNSGAYLCIASNGVQPSASKRQLLDVQYSPTITVPQKEIAGWVNEREVQLECFVDLNPSGSYHWVKLATSTTNTDRQPMVANQEDDMWLIEHDELMPSDKFDIVIKQISSEKVRMILIIRQVEKQDFSWYKCIAKNSLGLQSNFVRFYESPPGHSAATTASSSFSFKNIIRINDFVGGGGGSQANEQQQQDYNKLNLSQNDDSRLSFQRSSSSSARSSASPKYAMSNNLVSAHNLLLLLYNCQYAMLFSLVMITTLLNLSASRRRFALGTTT